MERDAITETSNTWLWWVIGLGAALLLLMIVLPALTDNTSNGVAGSATTTPGVPSTGDTATGTAAQNAQQGATEAAVEDVLANPSQYYGRVVSMSGAVDQIFGTSAVLLNERGLGGDTILVIMREGARVEEGQSVTVVGTIQRATVADIERGLGIDFTPDMERTLTDKPVLVADLVSVE